MNIKNNAFNRRGFLKSSVLSTAGALISSSAMGRQSAGTGQQKSVIRRKLGKTGLELPIVSFGVMRSDSASLVQSALEMGYVHFDTAYSYMNGRNEQMLGEVLKNKKRDSFVISTKIQPDVNRQNGQPLPESTKESFISKFEESLKRLQMDHVDILYMHGAGFRETVLASQYLEALTSMKQQGKARFVGLSTHQNEPDVIQAAIDSKVYDVVLTAFNFKHQRATEIKEKIALAAKSGLGIVVMKPMAGAFMDQERQRPINCKAALKWVLQDQNVTTTIPGITTFEMLTENFSVMESLDFTDEEKANLEEAKLVAGLYCGGCDQCTRQCAKGLPVHEIMRSYMYAYGYKSYEQAYSLLKEYDIQANPCGDCVKCTVDCPAGILVSDRIASVSMLSSLPSAMMV